jgi:co-chaperonin GroES (HSP10)
MRVLFDKVLIVASAAPTMKGSLYMVSPGNTEQVIEGTITQVGDTVQQAKVGNLVYFNKFSAIKITKDGKDYYVLPEKEIAAVE